MIVDFSGESQQDGSGISWLQAFTRQGSEVQILSRLPIVSKSWVVPHTTFLFFQDIFHTIFWGRFHWNFFHEIQYRASVVKGH